MCQGFTRLRLESGYVAHALQSSSTVSEEARLSWQTVANIRVEMFLPPYLSHRFEDLEHKQEPVKDIIVTDEEIANLLPS